MYEINSLNTIGMTILNTLLLLNLGTMEIILIVIVVLLLFGGKKIPELMQGIGKGVRSFKKGLNDVENEIKQDDSTTDPKN